jgi:hypothetical protein
MSIVIEKKKNRSGEIRDFESEYWIVLTVLKFMPPLECVGNSSEKWDGKSQPDSGTLGGKFSNHRQLEKFLLVGLVHQEDPDSETCESEDQHQ